ncbi:MAG: S8 family serine peptidase, partial [Pseudomonadota bacterium]
MTTPSHLVLLNEEVATSDGVARRLGMQAIVEHPRSRPGLAILESTDHAGHSATHYHSLGVLAGQLSDDHVKACEDAPEVTHVFRNEKRRVPVHIDRVGDADLPPCTDALGLIGMSATYDRYSGEGVTVALLDTGIDLQHPDFAHRFTEGANAVSFIEGESVQDGLGHGTHCAGIIAGPASPRAGQRFSVAPGVRLLVGKVLSDGGLGSDHQVVEGIHWALHQGARVIS